MTTAPLNRICCQEQLLPGHSLEEKWATAQEWGYEGIELRGKGDLAFQARLPELRAAARHGVVLPTVCVDMPYFVGDFDAERRDDALGQLRSQLSVIAEIGGTGVMSPASYGMFSRRLPPFEPPRTPQQDRAVLQDAFGRLAEHAAGEGVLILVEPLNRYEDHMVNRLADAVDLIVAVGSEHFRLAADAYHMNIEEADPAAALTAAAPYLRHVQVSDSNRLEPGAGHLDWAGFCGALCESGYAGDLAVECRLSGDASEVLPLVPRLLRPLLRALP